MTFTYDGSPHAAVVTSKDVSEPGYYTHVGLTNEWGFSQHLSGWSWFTAQGAVSLSAGTHTLVITGREPDTMLDAFRLTAM